VRIFEAAAPPPAAKHAPSITVALNFTPKYFFDALVSAFIIHYITNIYIRDVPEHILNLGIFGRE
jgi:hypothetical protein